MQLPFILPIMQYENPEIPEGINTTDESPLKEFVLLSSGVLLLTATIIFLVLLLVETAAQYIPFEFEQQLVTPVVEHYRNDNTPTREYLQKLADKVAIAQQLPPEMKISIHYVDDDTVNAFATLGGHLVLYRGLLEKLPNENALTMLLGHEIAHIKYRHPIKSLGSGLVLQILWALISNNSDSTGIIDMSLLTSLSFSRTNETEADEEGLYSVQMIYQDVNGATDLFQALMESPTQSTFSMPEYFSTHPDTQHRIEHLNQIAVKKGWSSTKPPVTEFPVKFDKRIHTN